MKPARIFKITKWDRKTVLTYALEIPGPPLRGPVSYFGQTFDEFGTLIYEKLIFKTCYAIINKPPQDLQNVDGKFFPCEPLNEQELRDLFDRYGK